MLDMPQIAHINVKTFGKIENFDKSSNLLMNHLPEYIDIWHGTVRFKFVQMKFLGSQMATP